MDRIDITPTPEACRQIARLFRTQQADAEALAARAARALDDLDGRADADLAPWDRALLAAAFEALYEDEGAQRGAVRGLRLQRGPCLPGLAHPGVTRLADGPGHWSVPLCAV